MRHREAVHGAAAVAFVLLLAGCGTPTPPQSTAKLDVEVDAQPTAFRIVRHDPFPWHEVTFTVNSLYHFQLDLVEDPVIEITYNQFLNDRGEPYRFNPKDVRLRIRCREGMW